ncbi:MAG: winged helix-turn-helix domain-containing protein [Nitrososphaeraceae archaeon]
MIRSSFLIEATMKNRTHHDILAKVLETAKGTDGTTKTRIMYGAYLSSNQIKEYIAYCQGHGLLSHDARKRVYKTTLKGMKLLEILAKMYEIVPSDTIAEISQQSTA